MVCTVDVFVHPYTIPLYPAIQHIKRTRTQILLARPEFTALATSAAVAAKLAPLTLAQHLHAPFDAMQRYETQLQALVEATEKGHPDHGPLLVSGGGGVRVVCRTHAHYYTHIHEPNVNTHTTGGVGPGTGHQGADGQDAGRRPHVPPHPGPWDQASL